jgi:pleckstrin homology domain-containing family M member 1
LRIPEALGLSDATSSLCSTLEAMFLHGLKDSLLQLTFSMLDTEVDRRPNPSFWSVVLLFLHKQVIQEIQELNQVNTEVGYSRAFVRKAINECLLSSYFQNIRKSPLLLKGFYHRHAFLFDLELLETIENLLMGTESFVEFNLPCNSSLLNVWNDAPLRMSGIYSAPLRSIPIACGEDVAGTISTSSRHIKIPNKTPVLSDIYSASISNSIFTNSPGSFADDDEKIARIMRKIDGDEAEEVSEAIDEDEELRKNVEQFEQMLLEKNPKSPEALQSMQPTNENLEESLSEVALMGNSVIGKQSWSEPTQVQTEEEPDPENVVFTRSTSVKSRASVDNRSFESLWNEKQKQTASSFKQVWERFEKTLQPSPDQNQPGADEAAADGFEVIKSPLADKRSMDELQQMVETLCRLSTEMGLDAQGFLCKDCKQPIGVDFEKATVCGFDARYYCSACISSDKFPIPAKIIFNWDFRHYPVSRKAAQFLTDYQFKPFIDFKVRITMTAEVRSVIFRFLLDTQPRNLLLHRRDEQSTEASNSTQLYTRLHFYMLRQHHKRASKAFIRQGVHLRVHSSLFDI